MLGINHCLKKTVTYSVVFLLISLIFIPCLNGELSEKYNENFYLTDEEIKEIINSSVLDLKYVYNITRDLSYIIFTEYDEENGELAKGRFFGTKGERKAAEILYDNMTELGLWTTLEKIENTPNLPELTHKYEILDYGLKINNRTIEKHEFHIVPSKIGPRNNSELKDYNFSFEGLKVIPMPDFPILWTLRNKNSIEEDFVFIRVDAAFNPDARSFINKIKVRFINPMKLIGIPTIINHAKRDFSLTRV